MTARDNPKGDEASRRAVATALDVMVKVGARKRLLAKITEDAIVDSAIDRVSSQIAEAFARRP